MSSKVLPGIAMLFFLLDFIGSKSQQEPSGGCSVKGKVFVNNAVMKGVRVKLRSVKTGENVSVMVNDSGEYCIFFPRFTVNAKYVISIFIPKELGAHSSTLHVKTVPTILNFSY